MSPAPSCHVSSVRNASKYNIRMEGGRRDPEPYVTARYLAESVLVDMTAKSLRSTALIHPIPLPRIPSTLQEGLDQNMYLIVTSRRART